MLLFLILPQADATVIDAPYALTSGQLEQTLTNIERPTLLFVYASWCPHCKQQAKIVRRLWEESQGRYHIFPLSLDTNPQALAKFWSANMIVNSTPVYYARDEHLTTLLARHGMHFRGGIPYMALLTRDGVINEHGGTLKYSRLKRSLEEAAKGIPADPTFNSY